jgi:nucleotide-binding universal stress UspA family protein
MYPMTIDAHSPSAVRAPAFTSVLCGVDGSLTSLEAARQAARLCAPGGTLRLVAVTWEAENGTAVSRWRADRSLSEARAAALDRGAEPRVTEVSAADPAGYLAEHAAGCGLIAVGAHGRLRRGGAALGTTATAVLHAAPVPVLVARRPPAGAFGESVLLAVDDTPSCLAAADVAGRIAAAAGGRAAIVAAPGHDAATRAILAEAAHRLREATGVDPLILDENGAAHRAVAAAAVTIEASVVVTGSRGLTGLQALHSVSERIARTAPCSVLVVRGAP